MEGFPLIQVPLHGTTGGEFRAYEDLSQEQQNEAEQLLKEASVADLYDGLLASVEAINRIGSLVGGIEGDDLIIEHNEDGSRTNITVNRQLIDEAIDDALNLGDADKEYMVYQRKANAEGSEVPVYGYDYVRGVPATEE